MKEKAIGKVMGGLLICLMLGLVFGGLIDTASATSEKTTVSVTDSSPWFTRGTNSGSGPWYSYTYDGHDYISTYVGGMSGNPSQPDCWTKFKPHLSQSGKYEVYAHFYACKDTSTKVPFTVKYDGGSTTIKVSQYRSSPAWKEKYLGTWDFKAGEDTYVKVTDATGEPYDGCKGLTIGAIKFVKVSQKPDPPTIISPGTSSAPGLIIDTLTPELKWNSVSGADYYALAISEYPYGPSHVIHNPQQLYGTSYTVPGGVLEQGKKYRWQMQAHNSAGWSDISNTLYFQTPGQKPDPPTLLSPGTSSAPGEEVDTLTPTLQWNAVSGADYYALAIREDPPNGPIVYNPQQVYGTSHSVPSGKLKHGHEYRWNMQAHGSGGWSSVSNTRYFQTSESPPSAPTTTSPGTSSAPGPVIDDLTPTLQWNAVSGADYYALAIREDPPNGPIVYNPQQVYGTSHSVPSGKLKHGHEYRWNMQAHGSGGWSSVSNTRYFQTSESPPSAPTTTSPGTSSAPGPVIDSLTPTLQWNAVSGAGYYALAIREDPPNGPIVYNPQQVYGTSHSVPSGKLKHGHEYRWNMQAHGSGGWSSVSNTRYFQTSESPPSAPTTTSPGTSSAPGPVIDSLTPTLQWNAVSGAGYYALAIREDPPNGPIVYNPQQVYGTSHSVPSGKLKHGHEYRWNMQAHGSGGWSSVSNTRYFQTSESPPSAPTTTSPGTSSAPGPVIDSLTPTLQWNAVSGAGYYALAIREDPPNGPIVYNPQQVYGTSHSVPSGKLKHGHEYRWNMQAHGSGGWSSVSNTRYFQTSESPPSAPTTTSPGTSSAPGPVIDSLTPTLQWNAVSGAGYYALALSEYPYGPSHVIHNPQQLYGTSYTVPGGVLEHGKKYRWQMQAHNSAGWSDISNTLYFQTPPPEDTTPPPAPIISSFTHPNENIWYANNDPSFTWTTPSDQSGIAGYSYTLDHSSSTIPGKLVDTTGNSKSYTNKADGIWYFHVRAKDNAGNWGSADHYRVKIDTTKPSASISINNGAQYTDSRSVTLYLSYSDATSGVDKCRYKNEGESWTGWGSCSSTKSWTLTEGEGTKKVYYQVKDKARNIREVFDTIVLDTTPPPEIELTPSSHIFGNVKVGECSSTYSFTLKNTGGGTATGSVYLTGTHASQFTITQGAGSFSLGADQTRTIKVKFCPASKGSKSATLYAAGSNCNDDSSTLSGTGEEETVHDMAVTNVYTTPSSPNVGQTTTIYVTVKNEGNQQEKNVPVKAYVDGSQVGSTQHVTLSAGKSTTKSFTWTPSTAKTYSVKGEVGIVSGETDTSDNKKIIGVSVSLAPSPIPPTTPSPHTGSIRVTTNLDIAFFTITGPETYQAIGKSWSISNVPAGLYTITYTEISGYIIPSSETKTLSVGGTITFSGTYTPIGIEEDPFIYQGQYIFDQNKLNENEKVALPYVMKYANEYHISPLLIMAIIRQESNFDSNAVGDGGLAIGYMQLHWDAAYDAGYRSARGNSKVHAKEDWPTGGLDPDTNIRYGCGYLKIVHDQWASSSVYSNPFKNAISAYNLGRTHGPDKSNENNYVSPVLQYYGEYKNKYNLAYQIVKNLNVPYIHQCWDTANDFDGRWACGSTSAVMVLAYYGKINLRPCECSQPYFHTSEYGNYVSEKYTSCTGYTFDIGTPTASGSLAYGAYGYIHYSDGLAKLGRMVDYFKKHGINSWEKYNPVESEVKAELDAGYPVPASTKLTSAGHWVVIKGYTDDGYYIVNDPYGNKPYGSGICGNYNGADVLYTWDEMKVNEKWIAIIHPTPSPTPSPTPTPTPIPTPSPTPIFSEYDHDRDGIVRGDIDDLRMQYQAYQGFLSGEEYDHDKDGIIRGDADDLRMQYYKYQGF